MRNERGVSLVEILVALLILTIVITTTIVMFADRQRRMKQATELMRAYQVLGNETEYWRRVPFDYGDTATNRVFFTETDVLEPMSPYTTDVKVVKTNDDVREITFTISWESGKKVASLGIVRADTGGDNPLW
jgi:prepilin-type N-terminal cleavage/methylation domain-containing protein